MELLLVEFVSANAPAQIIIRIAKIASRYFLFIRVITRMLYLNIFDNSIFYNIFIILFNIISKLYFN